MEYFVKEKSILRKIWGNSDTVLVIFAGASAEFALNKAVDWLYFTGKLPADPLGRLFSTISYARRIIFAEKSSALKSIQNINDIHASVERKRTMRIPPWAYRDVLFMLVEYSIKAYELLQRPLDLSEKKEILQVFLHLGSAMKLEGLPRDLHSFERMRSTHLEQHLQYGAYTRHLYQQYRKHLGWLRYRLLMETQAQICPSSVKNHLSIRRFSLLPLLLPIYKLARHVHINTYLRHLLLPSSYRKELGGLDHIAF